MPIVVALLTMLPLGAESGPPPLWWPINQIDQNYLYFFHGRIAAVLAHGPVKEREVPVKDIDVALERKRLFEQDPQAHTYREE